MQQELQQINNPIEQIIENYNNLKTQLTDNLKYGYTKNKDINIGFIRQLLDILKNFSMLINKSSIKNILSKREFNSIEADINIQLDRLIEIAGQINPNFNDVVSRLYEIDMFHHPSSGDVDMFNPNPSAATVSPAPNPGPGSFSGSSGDRLVGGKKRKSKKSKKSKK